MAAVVLRKVAEVLRFDCGQYTVSSRYICGFLRLSVVVNRREQRPEPYKWRETQSTKQSNDQKLFVVRLVIKTRARFAKVPTADDRKHKRYMTLLVYHIIL